MIRRTDRLTLGEVPARGPSAPAAPASAGGSAAGRPWVAIRWRCCRVYSRIYRRPEQNRYHGACPKCGQSVRLQVAPGGKDARFFEAG